MSLRLQKFGEKHLRLSGINPVVADALQHLPEILSFRDAPPAHRRLFPAPSSDSAVNAEWESFVTPDLRHLFVTAGESVTRDLTGLEREPRRKNSHQLTIPAPHADAWMNALNQGRLILAARHEVTEADMNRQDLDPQEPRDMAIFRIHILGYLLQLFIETAV